MSTNQQATYTAVTVGAVMINYAVGTGMLNLPHTVAGASIFTSLLLIIAVTAAATLLALYTLYTLRLTILLSYRRYDEYEESRSLLKDSTPSGISTFVLPNDHTMQLSRMCFFYYRSTGFVIYQIAIIFYMFGSLWGYAEVVSSSLASVIPFGANWNCYDPCGAGGYESRCVGAYWCWIAVCLVFSLILICIDLSKQKVLYVIFTVCRFTCIIGMALISFVSIFVTPFSKDQYGPPYVDSSVKMWDFDFAYVGTLFSSVTFAMILHHSIPGIVYPTIVAEQPKLERSFVWTFCILLVLTLFVSFPAALYFGQNGADLITLNLTKWDGKSWNAEFQPWWAAAISYSIRLLPPVYVLSAIPINGLTLANNILELFPERMRGLRAYSLLTKFIAIVPAVILAGFLRCLGDIIQFTGLCGFVLLLAPGILFIKSKKEYAAYFGGYDAKWYEADWIVYCIIGFNTVGIVNTVYSIIRGML